jgi:glycosyltransferase involved in cell wall biosynthesis
MERDLYNDRGYSITRLRVLQVLTELLLGGGQRMAVHLATHLDADRFDVRILSLYDSCDSNHEDILTQHTIPITYLGKRRGLDVRMYFRIGQVVRDYRPDIVHTHLYSLQYALPAIILQRVPVAVHTIHSMADKEGRGPGRLVRHLAFPNMIQPVAIAGEVERSLKKKYHLKTCPMIPNGIPVGTYHLESFDAQQWRAKQGFPTVAGALLFLSIARLEPHKGHQLLLRAFSRIVARNPHSHLLLAGDGSLRPDLEKQSQKLGIEQSIHFLGERNDIPQLLNAADIFVLASKWEGNPLSVMEAMAAGKPVVCSAVGGVPELVEHEWSGLLIPPGDELALAQAMQRLATDPALRVRLGREAANVARERFRASLMARHYEELYIKLLDRKDTVQ